MRILFIALLLVARSTSYDFQRQFIVWNVGQGSWSTLVDEKICLHFDMGGNHYPNSRLQELCKDKINELFLTHFDWDHLNFIRVFNRNAQLCLHTPIKEKLSPHKQRLLKSLQACTTHWPSNVIQIYRSQFAIANESHVYAIDRQILITGDTTSKYEKLIVNKLKGFSIRWLLAGHHGSRTSTSNALVAALPKNTAAIASAEKRKYGHPHSQVVERLRKNQNPLLRTEESGNIVIYL